MYRKPERIQRFCAQAAVVLSLCLFTLIALGGLFLTAHLCKQSWAHEAIVFSFDGLIANALLTLLMLGALLLAFRLLERFACVRLGAAMLGAWCLGTLVLVIGANVVQMYDFAYVMEGAQLFARGNYKPLTIDYFNVYSYQLGFCLPMELILRVLPGLNLPLCMQIANVFLSAGVAGCMVVFSSLVFSRQEAKALLMLYVLFLPMALQCIFVYSTLPMLFFTTLALLSFTLYLKKRKLRYGLAYALCISVACMLKPNAVVPLIAMGICALLDALTSRDVKLLLCAALSILCSVALQELAVLQYELRSGVTLGSDVSMLARLVMGLQRGGAQAGWFNRYTEQFFPFEVTDAQEYAIASADLAARLAEMRADPAMTLAFFRDKLFSQWLEPSYGAMWYGDLCAHAGPLSGVTQALFADGGVVRAVLERAMAIYQKLLYLLAAFGLARLLRSQQLRLAALVLPVCALGGCLYHMLFEAKAQYMYPYVLLMMPIAAHGLCAVRSFLANSKVPRGLRARYCK